MLRRVELLALLAMLSMLGALGIDAYLPSFPAIASAFGVSAVAVQQTLSVYVASMAITVLFVGTLSDALGRRPVVLLFLLLFTLSAVLALLANDIGTLILARAIQGAGAGVGMVLSRAIVQDRFSGSEAQRAMAVITMVFGVAPAFAPVVGGWLQAAFGWRSVFAMLALYGAALWIGCLARLPKTLAPALRRPLQLRLTASGYGQALRHPRFMLMVLGIALIFFGVALHISSASAFVIGILGRTETDFGWMFIPMTAGMVLGSIGSGRLARRVHPSRLTLWGFALMFLGMLGGVVYTQFFVVRLPYAILPLSAYTFGIALAMPGMIVAVLEIFPQMRGLAASLQSFIQMLVFALVSAFIAPLVFGSAQMLALAHLAGVSLGMLLWFLAGRWPQQRQTGERTP